MTFREARQIFEYWQERPPEHEMIILFAQNYLGWEPRGKPLTEDEKRAAHQASLEARWKAGALNVRQMFEATGGVIAADGGPGVQSIGGPVPGIGPFPGAH